MSQAVSRRTFMKATSAAGGGLMLALMVPACKTEAKAKSKGAGHVMSAFVQVATDGKVTITAPRPDMGQGVRTSLSMIIAEEMGVDWQSVQVVQAPGNGTVYGRQGVGGSGSVSGSFGPLRKVGATAALMVRTAASKKWGVPLEAVSIQNGVVSSGAKKAGIGEFAAAAASVTVPNADVPLKPKSAYSIIGKPTKRVDNVAVVTGKTVFGTDVRLPGLKHAVLARPLALGSRASSFDDAETKKVPGVLGVYQVGRGVAVVADSTWAAIKGRDALKVAWSEASHPTLTSDEISKSFASAVTAFPEMPAGAAQVVEAVYELPYLAHAPMESMNCTVRLGADSCEIWVPTQVPDRARDSVAQALQMDPAKVTLNVTLLGGGFGRRLSIDYINEAVQLAKQCGGAVQLMWTREDDMRNDNYRPANYHAMKGAVGADGMPVAFYHQLFEAGRNAGQSDQWGRTRLAYAIPNAGVKEGSVASPVPVGAWRSVENTYLNLVNECFFDELCVAGKKDPVKARLDMMQNTRLKRTLEKAAELAGWDKPLAAGWGRGVACFNGYGSYITQIAEVETRSDQTFRIRRMLAVVDCGLAVNPLGVEAQVQGAMMDAVSTLLHSAITINNGMVVQSTWAEFGWARMRDCPAMEVHIIADGDTPGGMGEVGFPAAGPAVLNAIANATGKRLRKLPIGNRVV